MIIEIHRKKNKNIGDHFCNPSRYFSFDDIETYDVLDPNIPISNNHVIIGGGGLIHPKFYSSLLKIKSKEPKKIITWGIGFNNDKGNNEEIKDLSFFDDLDKCGIRDFRNFEFPNTYIPCVSCMHSAFDIKYNVKNKISCFYHYNRRDLSPKNIPTLDNRQKDIFKTIKFIGETETLLTDSFHGAYWGQLLGKNVQVVSWSVKFDYFKNPPIYIEDWNSYKNNISSKKHINFLDECREKNKVFYAEIKKTIAD